MADHKFQGGCQSTCQMGVGTANIFRRDQRALLLHFTGLMVGPVSPRPRLFRFAKSALVTSGTRNTPNRRCASACGTATVVPLRLRSRCLSASASLIRLPNRRPKHNRGEPTWQFNVIGLLAFHSPAQWVFVLVYGVNQMQRM